MLKKVIDTGTARPILKLGGLTWGGGVVTASHENVVFLVTNNASREAKCVKTCQFIPII